MEEASYQKWFEILEKAKENFENRYVDLQMAIANLKVAEDHVKRLEATHPTIAE